LVEEGIGTEALVFPSEGEERKGVIFVNRGGRKGRKVPTESSHGDDGVAMWVTPSRRKR